MKGHLVAAALGCALLADAAVAAPDFTGTWVRDRAASDVISYPLYRLARPPQLPAGGGNQEVVVEIRQAAGSLQVVNPARPERSYMLDGKPHMTATDTGLQKAEVTATLRGDGLTIATTQPYDGMPGNVSSTTVETWRLSPDGTSLTISTVRDMPAEQQVMKEAYKRR